MVRWTISRSIPNLRTHFSTLERLGMGSVQKKYKILDFSGELEVHGSYFSIFHQENLHVIPWPIAYLGFLNKARGILNKSLLVGLLRSIALIHYPDYEQKT